MNRGYCNTVNLSHLSEKEAKALKNRGVSLARQAEEYRRKEDRRMGERGSAS
jgi:hypothetical protein